MLSEQAVLERAFRALDELAGKQVKIEAEPSTAVIPPAASSPEMPEPTPEASAPSLKKGQAVELWRNGSRFFVVADEEDAREGMKRLGARRGEIWTRDEIELVGRIEDQAIRDEVAKFKRQLDGSLCQSEQ